MARSTFAAADRPVAAGERAVFQRMLALIRLRLPQPAEHGVVIVRAGIGHAVFRVVVRHVHVVLAFHKRKLHHAHTRQLRFFQQVDHTVVDDAEVLGNDLRVFERAVHGVEEIRLRAVEPLPFFGGLRFGGHGPVGGKSAEVVDAHGVKQLKARAEAIHPPTVAVFFHLCPVIKRVAPLLAELAEIIRWHARHVLRLAVLCQVEQMAVRPHVGTVSRNVHRQIADDLHTFAVCIFFDLLPLLEERVLDELHEKHGLGLLLHRFRDGFGAMKLQVFVSPVIPLCADIRFFQDDIQRVVRQPALVFLGKRTHLIAVGFVRTGKCAV